MNKQRTFADVNTFQKFKRIPRREKFLAEMEQVVPWKKLCHLIEPFYPKGDKGRPPIGLERMLRIHFLQSWFNLSDPGVEEALYDMESMRRFVGIDLGNEPAPDETTVCKFRRLLEENGLGAKIFEEVNAHLEAKGVRLSEGAIVDATIVAAPSSTKNKEKKREERNALHEEGKSVLLRDEGAHRSRQQDEVRPQPRNHVRQCSRLQGAGRSSAGRREGRVGRLGLHGKDGGNRIGGSRSR